MKLELDLWCRLLDVYSKIGSNIWKHVEKKSGNLKKSKTRKHNRQNSENKIFLKNKRNLCRVVYRWLPTYQIWKIYLDLWVHDCTKWVWPTFVGKLGQSDPIMMKLKLDMSFVPPTECIY